MSFNRLTNVPSMAICALGLGVAGMMVGGAQAADGPWFTEDHDNPSWFAIEKVQKDPEAEMQVEVLRSRGRPEVAVATAREREGNILWGSRGYGLALALKKGSDAEESFNQFAESNTCSEPEPYALTDKLKRNLRLKTANGGNTIHLPNGEFGVFFPANNPCLLPYIKSELSPPLKKLDTFRDRPDNTATQKGS